jgi:peptidyl-prolyl cis-trans isomerase B (cyclophilin B)
MITLTTDFGKIIIALDFKNTPETAANFLEYAKSGLYSETIFHRVISGFMVQGGGLTTDLQPKVGRSPIKNEANKGGKNTSGSIAMARTSEPHSATSQFFINTANNDFLNHKDESIMGWGYCVFGQVIDGMDVVKKIEATTTTTLGGHENVPKDPITITDITINHQDIQKAREEIDA